MLIGVLSDTHGDLHPRLLPEFKSAGVELILHAGDVGRYSIIEQLKAVAPVHAVSGNVDTHGNVALLPAEVSLQIEGVSIYMTHVGGKPHEWRPRLPKSLPGVAICGHSHAPLVEEFDSVLFVNPGSAGTRQRFSLPLAAAFLRVENREAHAELILLGDPFVQVDR